MQLYGFAIAAAVLRDEARVASVSTGGVVKSVRRETDALAHPASVACGSALDGAALSLGRRISNGRWGTVYADATEAFAVKFEDDLHSPDAFARECAFMHQLHDTPARFPDCYGTCERTDKPELHTLVMDLVRGGTTLQDLNKAAAQGQALPANEAQSIGAQVYAGLVAMLDRKVVNVDQRDVNIMVSDGQVHFIDLGMANAFDEVLSECKKRSPNSGVTEAAGYLGTDAACQAHLGTQQNLMVAAALGALDDAAMPGAERAFCADPHDAFTRLGVKAVKLAALEVKKFFGGKYDTAPLFEELPAQATWRRNAAAVPSLPRDSQAQALKELPVGAELRAFKCDGEYGPPEKAEDMDARYSPCGGTYMFAWTEAPLRQYLTSRRTWGGSC